MEEEVTLLKNDTVRGIEKLIDHVKKWQSEGGNSNPRETALVITKLEEAKMWAFHMIKR